MLDHTAAEALRDRHARLVAEAGPIRAHDAARRLGVSEAELVAAPVAGGARAVRCRRLLLCPSLRRAEGGRDGARGVACACRKPRGMSVMLTRRRTLLIAAAMGCFAAVRARGDAPRRIVVAGGDLTEIVFALGAGAQVAGVDSTSQHPPQVTELPRIGYVRRIAPEGVLSLAPDLLIGAADAGPAAALDKLRAAGLRVATAPEGTGADAVSAKMSFIGGLLDRETEAAALAAQYRAEMARIAEAIAGISARPRVLFILSIQNGAPLVGGAGTSADAMIALAGGTNAAAGFDGYKPMNREAVLAAAPEAILMMDDHAESLGGPETVLARPEIALTPAGEAERAITMDGLLLLGFGPRTPEAVRRLAARLHPEHADRLGL